MSLGVFCWRAEVALSSAIHNYRKTNELKALIKQRDIEDAAASPITTSLEKLKVALKRHQLFTEQSVLPWKALSELDHGFGDEAQFIKLDWQNDDKTDDEVLKVEVVFAATSQDPLNTPETTTARLKNGVQKMVDTMKDYKLDAVVYPSEEMANTVDLTFKRIKK